MSKATAPPYTQAPPPYAPPSYSATIGGVPPQAPFTPGIHAPIVTTVVPLGGESTHMICPGCHAEINTKTESSPSLKAYLCGALLCLIGCDLGCCFIPCCMDSCMEVKHVCPNCKSFLGKYNN
ncbi:UNVERIFIED_CONTAM: hypothetical protein GTU68_023977 [Idotea baltica]|nr:hypothetical protein [Idotea baltica]